MPKTRSSLGVSRFVAVLGALPLGLLFVASDAHAQQAGTNAKPLPNAHLREPFRSILNAFAAIPAKLRPQR